MPTKGLSIYNGVTIQKDPGSLYQSKNVYRIKLADGTVVITARTHSDAQHLISTIQNKVGEQALSSDMNEFVSAVKGTFGEFYNGFLCWLRNAYVGIPNDPNYRKLRPLDEYMRTYRENVTEARRLDDAEMEAKKAQV